MVTWIGVMLHAVGMLWSSAAASIALFVLIGAAVWGYSRRGAGRRRAVPGGGGAGAALTPVSNGVNITSGHGFSHVGASERWPAVWVGQAAYPPVPARPPAPPRPPVPAAAGQRRRLSLRSVATMTHQRGRK